MPPEAFPNPPDDLARIERFIAAYNLIDDFLQRELGDPQTFRSAVDHFAKRHPWWRDSETLRLFATLRNFLVHEKTLPFDYPCAPSEAATREIERIRDHLTSPTTLGQAFGREVLILSPDQPLAVALELIHQRGVSRFPIYDHQLFVGLLTENGIARYLANNQASGHEFSAQIEIKNVLPRETKRRNYRFAAPTVRVAQVAFWFHDDTFLEAILIAPDPSQRPVGIVTRGDVAGWVE